MIQALILEEKKTCKFYTQSQVHRGTNKTKSRVQARPGQIEQFHFKIQ